MASLRTPSSRQSGIALSRARILILGVAYKGGVADVRESPALKLIDLLEEAGATVEFHDPHVASLDHGLRASVEMAPAAYDATVIVTAHPGIDYDRVVEEAPLVVDLRNATKERRVESHVWTL